MASKTLAGLGCTRDCGEKPANACDAARLSESAYRRAGALFHRAIGLSVLTRWLTSSRATARLPSAAAGDCAHPTTLRACAVEARDGLSDRETHETHLAGFAEPVAGPAKGGTRWLKPPYRGMDRPAYPRSQAEHIQNSRAALVVKLRREQELRPRGGAGP
jgi:hypothetical protein